MRALRAAGVMNNVPQHVKGRAESKYEAIWSQLTFASWSAYDFSQRE